MASKMSAARASGIGFSADEGEVWKEVAKRVHLSAARSDTGAYLACSHSFGPHPAPVDRGERGVARFPDRVELYTVALGQVRERLERVEWQRRRRKPRQRVAQRRVVFLRSRAFALLLELCNARSDFRPPPRVLA